MSEDKAKRPKVGVGVLIRKDNKVLMGKRKSKHGEGFWCPPGGHLEYGESWSECAVRETAEEAGIQIKNIQFGTATNDIHYDENVHYVTLLLIADYLSGEAMILEPDKCEQWQWVTWDNLPQPLFLPIQNALAQKFDPFKS